jgi:hypothetical protein
MTPIRQFIHFIPLKNGDQPCIVSVSRQHSKELAEKQAFLDLRDKVDSALFEKMCTKELTIDEDGVIRLVEEEA